MIRVVPFETEHLKTLEPDPEIHGHERHGWLRGIESSPDFVAASFLLKDKTLGVVGLYFFKPGHARCWAILSKEVKKYPVALYATVKRAIQNATAVGKATSFEAQIYMDKPILKRWIEKLGFSYSYTLGHYHVYDRRAS